MTEVQRRDDRSITGGSVEKARVLITPGTNQLSHCWISDLVQNCISPYFFLPFWYNGNFIYQPYKRGHLGLEIIKKLINRIVSREIV